MEVLIASHDQSTAERLRSALAEREVTVPLNRVLSFDAAIETLGSGNVHPELVFVVVSTDIERALVVLEQVRQRTAAKVIAVGSAHDPQLILRVVHAGPDDYLDADSGLGDELDRLVERMEAVDGGGEEGRLITFVSHSGGSGCSLLAANLAVALAREAGSCCLWDFNLRRGDQATLLNMKVQHSINDLCQNLGKLDRRMFTQSLLLHESGVHLLAAPPSLSEVKPVTVEAAERIVRHARGAYPFVVADLEDFFHREQFSVLERSDLVLFVLRLDFTALRNARRTLEYLELEGVDEGRVELVVNQYGRAREISLSEAESALGRRVTHFVPDDPKTVVASVNRGVPAMIDSPRSRIARAVQKLAERVAEPVCV